MQRIFTGLIAALASLGLALASTSALAQKAEAPKADAKKMEASKPAAKKAEAKAEAPKPDAAKSDPMDINSASEAELATLKGIGDVRAKAIVKGRPYKGKDDLVKKKILSKGVYDGIKDQIIAKQK
jgi:DNA uptake protein ComE-like DNA-binding protein